MLRSISLGCVLFFFWLLLSGHYTLFLVAVGVLTSAAIVAFARRMHIVDEEGHPIHMAPRALVYWPWLIGEIIKSAWSVTRIIVSPSLPISPTMTRVKIKGLSATGLTTYANSITLTPGTIALEAADDTIVVHALTRAVADDVESGAMGERVRWFERGR